MCWFNSGGKNMPDLEQQIAEWRQQMIAGGIKSCDVLDELESHLRDDIERQVRSGTDAPQAFHAAIGRLGTAAALRSGFAKAGRDFRKRMSIILVGIAAVSTGASVILGGLAEYRHSQVWNVDIVGPMMFGVIVT